MLALSAALLLSGCSIDQNAEIKLWRSVTTADLQPPPPYHPGEFLSLPRAMLLANQDNEQIALRGENFVQAIIDKNRAVAAFLPTVSFQPSFTIEQTPHGSASGTTVVQPTFTPGVTAPAGFVSSSGLSHRTELPVIGSMSVNAINNLNTLAAAEQNIEQQKQLLIDYQATLLLNVSEAYFQVLRSEAQVDVLRHSLQLQQARVADVQIRYQNHLALALELSQARAQAAGTSASLTQALTDVQNGRKTLAFLIHVPQVDGPIANDTAVPDVLPPLEHFQELARAARHDLAAAQALVKLREDQVRAAVAEYYPTVSLNIAGFLYREEFSSASKWDAILIANLPLFSAGIIRADVRDAWSRLRQAALNESYLRRQIDQDVQISYQNVQNAQRLLADLNAEVQAAADAMRQSQEQVNNGLAIPLDVLTAQNVLLNSQLSYTSSVFDRAVFYLDLLRASGQLTPQLTQHWPATTQPASMPTTVY